MKKAWLIFRWEIRRVLSNWKQTLSIFIVPAFVFLVALYLLPVMIDFLASGNVGRPTIYLIDPPESFIEYTKTEVGNPIYRYDQMGLSEFEDALENGYAHELAQQGNSFALFSAFPHVDHPTNVPSIFEDNISRVFEATIQDNADTGSLAFILVFADRDSPQSLAVGEHFITHSLSNYDEHLLETVGHDYKLIGGSPAFSINPLNPYTDLMRHRNSANVATGRILPAIVALILYYTIYVLTGEILSTDRAFGFLAKTSLTPIKISSIIAGKASAIILIGIINGLVIIGVLILTSWSNIQNNPFSLIPFGFFPFPSQIFLLLPILFLLSLLLTGYCFKAVFDHDRPQDVLFTLQFPLILFLIIFFMQIFRDSSSSWGEYFIPAYGAIVLMRDIFVGDLSLLNYFVVLSIHIILSIILFYNSIKQFSPSYAFSEHSSRRPQ